MEQFETLISFVIVGRNDNYGGDFRSRLQCCISSLFNQLNENKIRSEIIFVNYNPLLDSDIIDFIKWPGSNEYIKIKILTIPNELHKQFILTHNVKDDAVLEFPAKNAGIRRASGAYILSMNADIIIDDSVIQEFKHLQIECYYRTNRFDFRLPAEKLDTDKFISYAKSHIFKVYIKGGAKKINSKAYFKFQFYRALVNQKMEIIVYDFIRKFNFLWKIKLHPKAEYTYHCSASGDFTLMHSNNWHALRGYKENSYLALHVDALMVVQAAILGLKEKVFASPIYHQEHPRRHEVDNKNNDFRNGYLLFQKEAQQMILDKKPFIYNDKNWGFADCNLKEIVL